MRRWLLLRFRYWRRRALHAETQLREIRADYDAEIWRNRDREDTFVSAAIMGSKGMFGVAPRTAPARQRQQVAEPTYAADPFDSLSFADKNEFEVFWRPHIPPHVSAESAKRQFMAELASRKQPLNDDYVGN